MENKAKVCYILPFYEEGTDTHLFYNYLLIEEVKKQIDIETVIVGGGFPPLRFLRLFLRCLSLRSHGYTNFYVHYSYYGVLAAWLATWRPGRQVKVFYWNRGMPWLFKRGWFEETVFKFILRNTILVTGPESLAKEYVKHYGVKDYRVLSNWVDVKRFQSENSELTHSGTRSLFAEFSGKKIVLFVHHLSKRKGVDLIPEIAKGFGDDVLFLVIGDGPEKESLDKCGLENVKVLGKVPNRDIAKYFQAADVFLMPSREEGSPHVLLEAMASGTPFVASDVGGVRELVPRALEGYLCASEDVGCFRDKIKTLLDNSELYSKAAADCRDFVKKFDISRGVEEFTGLFN